MKNLKNVKAFYAICMSAVLIFSTSQAQVQTPKYFSIITNSKAFYEYLPQGYQSESQQYPLLIFVHGIGELGWGTTTSLPNVLLNGPPRVIKDGKFPNTFSVRGEVFKFIVLSPQFISWPTPTDIEELIDYAVSHYKVDVNRIYVTGLSMGGGVVWEYASKSAVYANRIAAIVPVCGVAPSNEQKGQIIASANLPVWATHNNRDGAVEVKNTDNFIYYINSSNPPPDPLAKKTIFDDDSHDAWSMTYNPEFKENGLNVYEWMLQYKRGRSNQSPSVNAGSDISITLPVNNAALAGSSTDSDGNVVRYNWQKVSGPSQFNMSNTSVANPLVSNLSEGEYTFRLTVTDNDSASASDDMIIKVNAASSTTPVSIPGIIQAENYITMSGIQNENTSDSGGGKNVGWIDNGDWMDYTINAAISGSYTVSFRVATPYSTQRFQLRKSNGAVLATVNVPETGGYQTWTTVSTSVYLDAGFQTLRIHSLQSGWNINWTEFTISPSITLIPGLIEAADFNSMTGVAIERSTDQDGGWNVGWIDNGDWMDYTINVVKAANYKVNFRIATPYLNQKFQLRNATGTTLANINVPQTGGYQTWTTVSAVVSLPIGPQTIRVHSLQSGWNIKRIEFVDELNINGSSNVLLGAYQNNPVNIESRLSDYSSSGIFPNPVKGQVSLQIYNKLSGTINVRLINKSGIIYKTLKFTKNQSLSRHTLQLNDLPAGTYILTIEMKGWSDQKNIIKL